MDVIRVYKCLCDVRRLRILNLLREGPLCVCHLCEILESGQVEMSKQLAYMKRLGMVRAERRAQWVFYGLPEPANPLLERNLACLQDGAGERAVFAADLRRRRKVLRHAAPTAKECAPTARRRKSPTARSTR
jgi:ArsR family transcriptional regulator, arsenate/arsenite/antimonite-responsive transcriptional repressor